jgi:hypothetical protein
VTLPGRKAANPRDRSVIYDRARAERFGTGVLSLRFAINLAPLALRMETLE